MPTRSLMRQVATGTGAAPRTISSRHFLKLIEETGTVGFWSADLRAERLDASPGLSRIFGLDPASELTFAVCLDMIHPEDQPAHRDQIAVLRSGQPINREFRIVRPDRTQRWVQHRAEVILGPDGTPSQGMGVVFDVTARHEALSALMQRHDRFDALITATASVFWANKADGRSSDMPQWMALTGQTHAQMQGLGWLDAVHPDDRARTLAAWMTAVERAELYDTDYRVLCADGVYRWFNARAAPVLNRDGSVREWVGVCLRMAGRPRNDLPAAASVASTPDAAASELADTEPLLTPGQIRAARGLTGLSKDELAALADVSVSTLNRLENPVSAVRPRPDTLRAVRRALEAAGVAFTFEPGKKPGLRET